MVQLMRRFSMLGLFSLVGCGGAPAWDDPAPAGPFVESFEAPADEVFAMVPELFRRMGFAPQIEVDPSRLTVETTQWITFSRSIAGPYDAPIVRCQSYAVTTRDGEPDYLPSRADVEGPGTMTLKVEVQPAGEGSVTRTTLASTPLGRSGSAAPRSVPPDGRAAPPLPSCATTGVLESQIAEALHAAFDPDYEPPAFTDGPRPF